MRATICVLFTTVVVLAAAPAAADALHDRLPACLACHGDKGQSATPETPSLGAQQQAFVVTQLYMFARSCAKPRS